ncbi:MAG: DUF3341 domain-containing protein [Fimbriimonadaceae bacterium]|nr:DUF3341 domain-containing protein [Fimbriimonadaceae bacterium]
MSETTLEQPRLHGILAEFDDPDDLLEAAERTHAAGYTRVEAYTPFPVHGLSEAIGFKEAKVPWLIFVCGVIGAFAGLGLQYYTAVIDYPMNVGGRPNFSWPSFFPVTFECTILFAAFGAVFGMLGMNGMPRPHHPIFGGKNFELASQNKFFLCVESDDPQFDPSRVSEFLRGLGAQHVSEVEND